jgi:hypothetical protein
MTESRSSQRLLRRCGVFKDRLGATPTSYRGAWALSAEGVRRR